MTNFDLSPLYRSTVGFDHLFDMLDQASRVQPATWPPYNIERLAEDQYRIVMALAGFGPDEIELVQKENALFVAGQKLPDPEGVEVLHRGIATRAFKQTFNLADHVKVTGGQPGERSAHRRTEAGNPGSPEASAHRHCVQRRPDRRVAR